MSTRRTGPHVLIARAQRQAELLEGLRVRAADQVISLETNP
jgi:hypothetical protein